MCKLLTPIPPTATSSSNDAIAAIDNRRVRVGRNMKPTDRDGSLGSISRVNGFNVYWVSLNHWFLRLARFRTPGNGRAWREDHIHSEDIDRLSSVCHVAKEKRPKESASSQRRSRRSIKASKSGKMVQGEIWQDLDPIYTGNLPTRVTSSRF